MIKFSEKTKGLIFQNYICGLNRRQMQKLLEIANPEQILNDFYRYEIKIKEKLNEETALLLKAKLNEVSEVIENLYKNKIKAVSMFDKEYPVQLKYIDDNPLLLYCKGNLELMNGEILSVVGTRNPDRYGKDIAKSFVERLSTGFAIASGMALGIDTAALKTALDNSGKGIAVIAGGIDFIYPPENRELYEQIAEKGLIISEYGLGIKPQRYMFPERNRIISGIAKGVFIVEAGLKSGSLITAEYALLQGKEVFCVPSDIDSKKSAGTNKLLYDMTANLVLEPNHIAEKLNVELKSKERASEMQLDFLEEKLIEILELEELHFDELLEITKLSVAELSSLLAKMELFGYIKRTDGNRYKL